jgi:hypothetical protein
MDCRVPPRQNVHEDHPQIKQLSASAAESLHRTISLRVPQEAIYREEPSLGGRPASRSVSSVAASSDRDRLSMAQHSAAAAGFPVLNACPTSLRSIASLIPQRS